MENNTEVFNKSSKAFDSGKFAWNSPDGTASKKKNNIVNDKRTRIIGHFKRLYPEIIINDATRIELLAKNAIMVYIANVTKGRSPYIMFWYESDDNYGTQGILNDSEFVSLALLLHAQCGDHLNTDDILYTMRNSWNCMEIGYDNGGIARYVLKPWYHKIIFVPIKDDETEIFSRLNASQAERVFNEYDKFTIYGNN